MNPVPVISDSVERASDPLPEPGPGGAVILSPDDPRWDAFLRSARHDVYATPAYLRLSATHEGGRPVAVLAGTGDRQVLIPLLIRPIPEELLPDGVGEGRAWLDAASPYGYPGVVISDALRHEPGQDALLAAALRAAIDELVTQGVVTVFLRSHPLLPVSGSALATVGAVVTHGETVSIDLTIPAEGDGVRSILPDINRNHRRSLDRLAREGFTCEIVGVDDDEIVAAFLEIYHGTMDRLAATSTYYIDAGYVRALDAAAAGGAVIALVRRGETIAAAGLLTVADGIIEDVFGGARPEFDALAPTKLKIPGVTRWGRERGYRVYHLGGGLGGENNDLFRFKAGFSDRRHPFQTVRITVNPARQTALDAAWSARSGEAVSPPGDGGFFPAYRAPVTSRA